MNSQLETVIDQWINKVRDEYVADVIAAVNIPSVSSEAEGKFTFGKDCARMLDHMEEVAQKYNFSFTNHEYYCGTSLFEGTEGKHEIGLFSHLDVVPAGEGWATDPFSAFERDGYIVGRGSNDNKGSAFACVYAMRFLQEQGIRLKNNLRLLYGCNEEAGMEDVKYYLRTYGAPTYTLVADSWFPVSGSEKGRYVLAIDMSFTSSNLVKFFTPGTGSSIPNKCLAVLSGVDAKQLEALVAKTSDITCAPVENGVEITAYGAGNHPAFPEGSINAVKVMLDFLLENEFVEGDILQPLSLIRQTLTDYYGYGINAHFEDDFAGSTTHVLTQIELTGHELKTEYVIAYPAAPSVDKDQVLSQTLETFNKPWIKVECTHSWDPHFVDLQHPIVEILTKTASHIHNYDMKPFAMAGGTYTWVTPNSFAAGPNVHHLPQTLYTEPGHGFPHQPDECMRIDVWLKGIKIYILALLEIDEWLSAQ